MPCAEWILWRRSWHRTHSAHGIDTGKDMCLILCIIPDSPSGLKPTPSHQITYNARLKGYSDDWRVTVSSIFIQLPWCAARWVNPVIKVISMCAPSKWRGLEVGCRPLNPEINMETQFPSNQLWIWLSLSLEYIVTTKLSSHWPGLKRNIEILRTEKRPVQGDIFYFRGYFLFQNVNVPGKIYKITSLTPPLIVILTIYIYYI